MKLPEGAKWYAAGLFDGDGSVSIRRLQAKRQRYPLQHQVTVQVCMTKQEAVLWLQTLWGGAVCRIVKDGRQGLHYYWHWMAVGQAADAFLQSIEDCVKVKKEEVRLALEFRTTKLQKGQRMTDQLFARREELAVRLARENSRLILLEEA